MLTNSGMTPMPSGARRTNSSVEPGLSVGCTMPTMPRQLVNAMGVSSFSLPVPRIWGQTHGSDPMGKVSERLYTTAQPRRSQPESTMAPQFPPDIRTPAYVIDAARLERNLATAARIKREAGAKMLLATKAFALPAVFPMMREVLDGTTASGEYEARLGAET